MHHRPNIVSSTEFSEEESTIGPLTITTITRILISTQRVIVRNDVLPSFAFLMSRLFYRRSSRTEMFTMLQPFLDCNLAFAQEAFCSLALASLFYLDELYFTIDLDCFKVSS
jgi:hypothetical protein